MSAKNKVVTGVMAVLLIGILLAAVLLGIYFGTRDTKGGVDYLEIPYEYFSEAEQVTVDRKNTYIGHPDLVLNNAGKLITMYPLSHGKGAIVEKTSDDFGRTWSERVPETPASWVTSQETPTLYNLHFTDGSSKIVLISGCPTWTVKKEVWPANGFNFSVSSDDSATWSEFENFYGIKWAEKNATTEYDGIVAMSSLTQVKENGQYIDRWMGTFHNHSYLNYKTFLTFDEDGNAEWTKPEPLLHQWREIESYAGMCELEIIRTPAPNDGTLILIARANNRTTRSLISFSDDEGATWTEPTELPYALSGDRHKAEYDKTTGKLAISFRSIAARVKESALSTQLTYRSAGWICWVGTFDDLLSYKDADKSNDKFGEKVIILGTDYSGRADCGYAGTAINNNGEFVMISYGCFSKNAKVPYIMAVRFKL